MRLDPAPFYVDLFLYYCENKWINKIKKKTDNERARHFGNIFQFIDDLTAINDCGEQIKPSIKS